MSQENVDLVTSGYDDFNRGDIQAVTARFSPEIEWVEPGGGNAPSGAFHGPEAVANEVFGSVPQNFDEFTCTVEDARDEGDTVVVTRGSRARIRAEPSSTPRQSMSGAFVMARSCAWRTRSTEKRGVELTGADAG